MNNIYAIFLDIDGTLLSSAGIPQKNIDAINRVRQKGHLVFVNTGRSYSYIPKEVQAIELDGVVAANGAYVRCQDKILRNFTFSQEELIKIVRYLCEAGKSCNLEGPEQTFFLNRVGDNGICIASHEELLNLHPQCKISIISVWSPITDEERALFQDKYFCLEHEHYYEFTLKDCSKALGMKIILEHLGLDKSNSIAIGDSMNDMDMLEYAGISVAMGNAVDAVKKVCNFVTTSAEEGGVAEALNRLIP